MDAYITQDKDLPPIPTDDCGCSRSVSQDSQVSDLRSKYDPFPSAALRAGTFGETGSTECQTPPLDIEANVGEVTAHVPSHDLPSVPSSGEIIVPIQTPDRAPARELSVTYTPESFNALLQQQTDEVSAMLSTAGLAQSRRRRLRAATIRARKIAEDLASPEFSFEDLNVVVPAGPTDDGAAVNSEEDTDSSASDDAGLSSTVAPVSSNPLSHENPSKRTIHTASPAVPNVVEPSEINHFLDSEEVYSSGTCSPDRDSWVSFEYLISLFDDDEYFSPLLRGELDLEGSAENCQPPINSEEGDDVAAERSSYDPVLQCYSIARTDNHSTNDSAEIESRINRRERGTGAADEARSSSLVAPTPSTAYLRTEHSEIVIQLTPPSPPSSIKASQSNRFAQTREMNWYTSHRRPHHRRVSYSPTKSDRSGLVGRQADGLSVTIPAETLSRYLRNGCQPASGKAGASQHLVDAPPVNRTAFETPAALVEREFNAQKTPPEIQAFFAARSSRPNAKAAQTVPDSADSFDNFSPATSQISGPTTPFVDSAGESINTGVTWRAAGGAEPSSDAAPIQSLVRRFSEAPASRPIRQQARAFTSRITSSLREWGNAASKLLTGRRTADAEGGGTFNPQFDPWEGFVPTRGPSPDLTPDDDIGPPKSNIWNIYV
ncbi:hypothetical protein FRC01_005608 [Tulasnella sp. 417]|nr:hypothetical protein FRC01_005608 [Tulasnella sp. 417]